MCKVHLAVDALIVHLRLLPGTDPSSREDRGYRSEGFRPFGTRSLELCRDRQLGN